MKTHEAIQTVLIAAKTVPPLGKEFQLAVDLVTTFLNDDIWRFGDNGNYLCDYDEQRHSQDDPAPALHPLRRGK